MSARIREIAAMPTVHNNVHESVYRSYHILAYVEDLLRRGTPGDVVRDLLDEIKAMGEEHDRSLKTPSPSDVLNKAMNNAIARNFTGQ